MRLNLSVITEVNLGRGPEKRPILLPVSASNLPKRHSRFLRLPTRYSPYVYKSIMSQSQDQRSVRPFTVYGEADNDENPPQSVLAIKGIVRSAVTGVSTLSLAGLFGFDMPRGVSGL